MNSQKAVAGENSALRSEKGLSGPLYLVLVSAVAALGGLLFGYDTAVISGAIDLLQIHFALSPVAAGWAASSALAGAVIGAAAAGIAGDALGRRAVLVFAAACFLVSAIGAAVAGSFSAFVAFRLLGGAGIGAASLASPLYIAEIAPARWRGKLVSLNQLAIVSGILVIYAVNYLIRLHGTQVWNESVGWRWMFASGSFPALLLLGFLFLVPESPRFLLLRGRSAEAAKVAARVGSAEEIFRMPVAAVPQHSPMRRVLLLGITLAALQQLTGINVILYFAPEVFRHIDRSGNAAMFQTVLVGAANLLFTIVAMASVDKAGRKPLLVAGSLGMAICLAAFGVGVVHSNEGIWPVAFVLGYIAFFALSVGPVTWVVLSEIFPAHFRARAMAMATVVLWVANFAVSQTFPMLDQSAVLIRHFGHGFPFFLYAAFCIAEACFVLRALPETKNRTLEEISNNI